MSTFKFNEIPSKHYAKMWFLLLGYVAIIAQNTHVVVIGLES